VEGGGEVAFVRHTTILENTAGRNPMLWSRNVIPDDFELLCRDGTRARHNEYRKCNLGQVPANALVTSGDRHPQQIDAYINLFLLAQELYGSKYSEDYTFKMFVSEAERGVPDLIFQDSTSSLVAVPEHRRPYLAYLGPSFVHAFKRVDCAWSSSTLTSLLSSLHIISALVIIFSPLNRLLAL
jgi:melanoma-associated antigen p97